jgi:hypothetical protein
MEAGAKTATAIDNEVNHCVGEKEVMVASGKAQQGPKSEIATTVDKDVANENINTDASVPSETEKVGTSEHSQKIHNQRSFNLKTLQIMLVQKRIKIWKTVMVQ